MDNSRVLRLHPDTRGPPNRLQRLRYNGYRRSVLGHNLVTSLYTSFLEDIRYVQQRMYGMRWYARAQYDIQDWVKQYDIWGVCLEHVS